MEVEVGDYELNYQYPSGAPTLIPAPALERALDFRRASSADQAETGEGSGSAASQALPPCAVHIHGFHLQELEVLLDELSGVVSEFDLLITTNSTEKQEAIERMLRHHPISGAAARSAVLVTQAPGRNVGALLVDAYDHLLAYDCVLHMHTKRSVHTGLAEEWRRSLVENLIGSAGLVRQIRQAFQREERLGLLIPQTCPSMRKHFNWGDNFSIAQSIWQGIRPERPLRIEAPLVFPLGMMFWFRPRALQPLRSLCQRLEPLPIEPLPLDGTSLHALERLVAHGCEAAGFHWQMISSGGSVSAQRGGDLRRQLSVLDERPLVYLQACSLLAEHTRRIEAELDQTRTTLEASQATLQQLEQGLAELQQTRQGRTSRLPRGLTALVRRIRQRR